MTTIDGMRFMHKGKICVCRPDLRDERNRVVTWHIVRVVDNVEAARAAIVRLELEGMSDLVAISPSETFDISGDLAAKFFRVYYGLR